MVEIDLWNPDGTKLEKHITIPPHKLKTSVLQDGSLFYLKDPHNDNVYFRVTHFDIAVGYPKSKF